jgi:hypothetical protein
MRSSIIKSGNSKISNRILYFILFLLLASPNSAAQNNAILTIAQADRYQSLPGKPLIHPNFAFTTAKDTQFFRKYRLMNARESLPQDLAGAQLEERHYFRINHNAFNIPASAFNPTSSASASSGDSPIVAIIDTGIDYYNIYLASFFWINSAEDLNGNGLLDSTDINGIDEDGNGFADDVIGYDFTDAPEIPDFGDYLGIDPFPDDEFAGGHGTPVAHVIALAAGAEVQIMNIRAGTAGGFLQEDDVANAIVYAWQNGASIINMSFGDVRISRALADIISYVSSRGVTFVASAGNSGSTDAHYPSSLREVISVGSVNESGIRSGFSNYGYFVDIYALGSNVYLLQPDGEMGYFSGTSFSAPLVSAGLGRMLNVNPDLSVAELSTWALLNTADKGNPGWDFQYGNGIFSADRLNYAAAGAELQFQYPDASFQTTDSLSIAWTYNGFLAGNAALAVAVNGEDTFVEYAEMTTFGSDSLIYIAEPGDTLLTLRLSWMDNSGKMRLARYLEGQRFIEKPHLLSYRLLPVIEQNREEKLLIARSDQPALLFLEADNIVLQDNVTDTLAFLPLGKETTPLLRNGQIAVRNENGQSDFVEIPDIEFPDLQKQTPLILKTPLLTGNGYAYPYLFNDELFFVSRFSADNSTILPLSVFRMGAAESIYSFAAPWIIRDHVFVDNQVVRLLLGFGNASKVVDFSLSSYSLLREWDFPGNWAVRFVEERVLFRVDPNYVLRTFNGASWEDSFVFDEHPQTTLFSVPDAVFLSNYVLFADIDGRVFVYEGTDLNYTYLGYFRLEGRDPANMIVRFAEGSKESFWALSEVGPTTLTETSIDAQYWVLEGFEISGETFTPLVKKYFAGVSSRKEFSPGLEVVQTADKKYLNVNVYPESYFFTYEDDSLQMEFGQFSGDGWYNYKLPARLTDYLVNRPDQSIDLVQFDTGLSLQPPANISWFASEAQGLVLAWQGQAGIKTAIHNLLTGDTIRTFDAYYTQPDFRLPSAFEYRLRFEDGDLNSEWSDTVKANLTGYPVVDSLVLFENNFLEMYFSAAMLEEGGSVQAGNGLFISGILTISPTQKMTRISGLATITADIRLSGFRSSNHIGVTDTTITIAKSAAKWQPLVESVQLAANRLVLDFNTIFSDSVLNMPGAFRLMPLETTLPVESISGNRVILQLPVLISAGFDYALAIAEMTDINGQKLAAQSIWIEQPLIENISKVVIYPQPARIDPDLPLTIAGLPGQSELNIMDSNGRLIRSFEAQRIVSQSLEWDFKTNEGQLIGSGVYLVLIHHDGETKVKKIMVIR